MIGCYGTRSALISSALKSVKLEHVILGSESEISSELDFVIASGVYHKFNEEVLFRAPKGIFVFHESDLPLGQGCAPLAWTLILQLEHLTVTLFQAHEKFDTGPYLDKGYYRVKKYDSIQVLRTQRDILIRNMIVKNARTIVKDKHLLTPQRGRKIYFPKRFPHDSVINDGLASQPLWLVWRQHLRACHNTDFPALYRGHPLYYSQAIRAMPLISSKTKFIDLKFPCCFKVDDKFIMLSRERI